MLCGRFGLKWRHLGLAWSSAGQQGLGIPPLEKGECEGVDTDRDVVILRACHVGYYGTVHPR